MKILYLRDDIYSPIVQRQVVQWPEESYQVKYYLVWQYCEVKNMSFQEAKKRLDKHLPLGRYISWDALADLNLQTRFEDVDSSQYFPIIDGVKCVTVDWVETYHPQVDISKHNIIDA